MKAQIRQSTIAICGLATLVLTGCVKPPKYQAPAPPAAPAWNISQEKLSSHMNAGAIDEQWWASFHDPVLTSLVERLAKQNIEIKVAAEHIAQARDARKITRSAGLPSMNAGVGYSHTRLSPNGFLSLVEPTPGSSTEYNLFSDNLSASWDLDLNGRIRHQVEAANASIQLSIDDIHALEVAEVSELAQDYVQLRGLQAAHALLLEEVDLLSQEESLILQQYQEGVANLSDTAGVKADREALQSTIPGIESAAHARIEAISYLLGLSPGELDKELQSSVPQPPVPSIVSVGLPGDLVRRRPDVRGAENALELAVAQTGVAAAQFYPDVKLSGDFGFQGLHVLNLFSMASRAFDVGPVVSIPIFEGGRLTGELKLRESQQKEAALNFQKTVLAAWRDVDIDMDSYSKAQASNEHAIASASDRKQALDMSQQQFTEGATTKLSVLRANQSYLESKLAIAATASEQDQRLVLLYESLGGGWVAIDSSRH